MRTPGSAEVTYRPAVEADLPAGSAVFNRAQQDLFVRRGFAWDDRPLELFAGPQRHILGTDPGRAFVAERAGSVVGYASAIARGPLWYFSARFIDWHRSCRIAAWLDGVDHRAS